MRYVCRVCGYVYDEEEEGVLWEDLPDGWLCPVCGSGREHYGAAEGADAAATEGAGDSSEAAAAGAVSAAAASAADLRDFTRSEDAVEVYMADIHRMAETGESILEPMRTRLPVCSWDDILIKGAQLSRLPLNEEEDVSTTTVIGPNAAHPLSIETPVFVTHMSFGALSREAKLALARGSASMKTAMCSGEGGILPESLAASYRYILEYVPNRYSVTDENLQKVDAVEIKIGQSAKPGMGGHLPGRKVTEEIAAIRGFKPGEDIISPAHYPDIRSPEELSGKVAWLREKTGGKPIGVKLAAGNLEEDLKVVLAAAPDFVTIDGRAGATGAAPKFIKASTSIPSVFALYRARELLDRMGAEGISLIITGGLRISPDFAKALALGADAVAIGTAALMACGCQQFRICDTGRCPRGITSQDPELRARLDVDAAARGLANFLKVATEELKAFARLTGHDDVHGLSLADLCTTNTEISAHTKIAHV